MPTGFRLGSVGYLFMLEAGSPGIVIGVKLGFLDCEPKKSRTLVLTPLGGNLGLPFCGRVPAGDLREAIENQEDAIEFDHMFPSNEGHTVLVAVDPSMEGLGIRKGDWVIRNRSKEIVGVVRKIDSLVG